VKAVCEGARGWGSAEEVEVVAAVVALSSTLLT